MTHNSGPQTQNTVVFDAVTATNPYSYCGRKIVVGLGETGGHGPRSPSPVFVRFSARRHAGSLGTNLAMYYPCVYDSGHVVACSMCLCADVMSDTTERHTLMSCQGHNKCVSRTDTNPPFAPIVTKISFPHFSARRGPLTPQKGEDTSGTRVRPHVKFGLNRPAGCREIVDKITNEKHTVKLIPCLRSNERMAGNNVIPRSVIDVSWYRSVNFDLLFAAEMNSSSLVTSIVCFQYNACLNYWRTSRQIIIHIFIRPAHHSVSQQEAQLSQRGRAMLRVCL